MAGRSIINHLNAELSIDRPVRNSLIDSWLEKNPDKLDDLKEALKWFYENRSSSFGWSVFHNSLTRMDGWSSFPEGTRVLKHWAQRKLPELFKNVS